MRCLLVGLVGVSGTGLSGTAHAVERAIDAMDIAQVGVPLGPQQVVLIIGACVLVWFAVLIFRAF